MQYRKLGQTNLQISEIGYGTWQFANDSNCWVGSTKKESERSLLYAIDHGLNFIDTARSYGDGLAEKWIGEIIKKRRDKKIIISSKMLPKNWQWPARSGTDIQDVFPKKHIIDQVDESLKELDAEVLDIMMFHVWLDEWATQEEWKETIQEITKAGKVKYWGISTNNHESTNCIKACETGLISVVETIFNIFYQEPINSLFPFINNNNIGLIARVPLDEGGLTGTINSKSTFSEGDFRRSYFSQDRLVELEQRIVKLKKIVDESSEIESLTELALKFILHFDEVSTVIPGMRKLHHVEENLSVSMKSYLSDQLFEKLLIQSWNRNFYGNNPWEE